MVKVHGGTISASRCGVVQAGRRRRTSPEEGGQVVPASHRRSVVL